MRSTLVHIKSYIRVLILITSALVLFISCSAKFNSENSALANGEGNGTTNTATIPSASVTKFVITAPGSNATAGSPYNITITAQDSSSAVVASYSGTVTLVTNGSATGGGVVTITNGTATIAVTDNVAETVNLSLTDTAVTGFDVTSTASLTVNADSADHLEYISGNSQSEKVQRDLAFPLSLRVKDRYNNGVSGVKVSFLTTENNGRFESNLVESVGADGDVATTFFTGAMGKLNNIIVQTPNNNLLDLAGSGNTILNFKANTVTINDGTFQASALSNAPVHASLLDFKLVDLNDDQLLDILAIDSSNKTAFYKLRNVGGSFDAPVVITTLPDNIRSFEVGDFNFDSNVDFVVGDNAGRIYQYLGDDALNFTAQDLVDSGLPRVDYMVAGNFFNHSGSLDLAVASSNSRNIKILRGDFETGRLTTSTTQIDTLNNGVNQLASGDMNGDNLTDLIYGNINNSDIHVRLQQNDGSFSLVTTSTSAAAGSFTSIAIADFNSDEIPDIIYVDNPGGRVYHQLGTGNGEFNSESSDAILGAMKVTVTDFNGDQALDYVVTIPSADQVAIQQGDDTGSFTNMLTLTSSSSNPTNVCVGSLDHDNKVDVVTADLDATNAFSVFKAN